MKYFIASDHAGLEIKAFIKEILSSKGFDVEDLGPFSNDRVDYPDFAQKVCESVQKDKNSNGVLICGSGLGMSMAANKFENIRAALCHNTYSAKMAKAHNNANVLCLGERVSGYGVIEDIINTWCENSFEGGRHTTRVEKIDKLFQKSCRD